MGIAVLAGLLAVALRLPFVHGLPYTDEGGLLVVAADWHASGRFLYGPLFVDRPPLLLAFFRLAAALGGVVQLRLLALALVAAAVLCAARAGRLLGGDRGAIAAALTCAALLANPQLGTREVDAETVGAPLVLLAALLALEGVRGGRCQRLMLVGSGAAAASALLVKQNLADGLAFAVTLILALGVSSRSPARHAVVAVGCLTLGAAVPVSAALAWSATATGARGLWYSMYGFRIASSDALFSQFSPAQMARLHELGRAALLSGLALLIVAALIPLLHRGTRDAVTVALVAMLVIEVAGVAGGGYYWNHYLIALVPATCLLVGRAAGTLSRPFMLAFAVAVSMIASVTSVAVAATQTKPSSTNEVRALSAWLESAKRPGDSAVVLYGEAAIFETTRLRPAYPFLWTLPQRVLDPHLTRLTATMERTPGPTFVVVRSSMNPSRQEPHRKIQLLLDQRYRLVAHVCDDSVYVRRGQVRTARSPSDCT